MSGRDITSIKTFGLLKASGYKPRTVKQELRNNTIKSIGEGEDI